MLRNGCGIRGAHKPIQKRYDLRARAGIVWAEGGAARAEDDAGLSASGSRVVIIGVRGNVRK